MNEIPTATMLTWFISHALLLSAKHGQQRNVVITVIWRLVNMANMVTEGNLVNLETRPSAKHGYLRTGKHGQRRYIIKRKSRSPQIHGQKRNMLCAIMTSSTAISSLDENVLCCLYWLLAPSSGVCVCFVVCLCVCVFVHMFVHLGVFGGVHLFVRVGLCVCVRECFFVCV